MRVLITGGTGFIGGALIERLCQQDTSISVYTRSTSHFDTEFISYLNRLEDIPEDTQFDAFINLAGESMVAGRWNEARKAQLVASRIDTTRALVALAARLRHKPRVVLSASAIGIYGHQGDDRLAEDAGQEDGFAHRLCQAWETEAHRFEPLGIRLCILRLGVVLASEGGAMEQLRRTVAFGVGTWLGSGKQWLSWVHRDDVTAAMEFLLADESRSGSYNITAPEPVTNRGLCDELSLRQQVFLKLSVPGFVMRLALGEMALELLLNGQRVVPRRLQEAGFEFRYETLREALPALYS
ncbi:MAG: TIGR01777 family oxidoreductase [Gammaproteobacteria bacterium]|nr:TIGR01777 family oxidoreductase [Gammaproteobacteria bacterium]